MSDEKKGGGRELLLLVAATMPREELVEKIKDCAIKFAVLPEGEDKEQAYKELHYLSMLMNMKGAVETMGIGNVMAQMEETERAVGFFQKRPGQEN